MKSKSKRKQKHSYSRKKQIQMGGFLGFFGNFFGGCLLLGASRELEETESQRAKEIAMHKLPKIFILTFN